MKLAPFARFHDRHAAPACHAAFTVKRLSQRGHAFGRFPAATVISAALPSAQESGALEMRSAPFCDQRTSVRFVGGFQRDGRSAVTTTL